MSTLKYIFVMLLFSITYYIMYKFLGFELTVIVGIAQIISSLIKIEESKPKKTQPSKPVYIQPKTRMRF